MKNEIEIIPYSDEYKEFIKTLNYEWLLKYFHVEIGDEIALSNPKEEIIDKGGFIFYAKYNQVIVGTVSLLKKDEFTYELAKMAVSDSHQSFGIGKKILDYCLKFAQEQQIKRLILYSNTKLESAIHLYKKYGFAEVELEKGLYERANIKMEFKLNK